MASLSMSRSQTSSGEIQSLAEAMLRSSLSSTASSISSTSSSKTATHPFPVTPISHSRESSTSSTSSVRTPESSSTLVNSSTSEWFKNEGHVPELSDTETRIRQLKQDILAAEAALPKRSTTGLFKEVCSTDLLFLIDATGSMAWHIRAAKKQVKSIVDDIGLAFLNEAEVRMAVVAYRDHCDSTKIEFLDFTVSTDQVHSFLDKLTATGGGDRPEDVLGGIQKALNATWMNKTRCIIHIADAPPHGCNLHDLRRCMDSYPDPGTETHRLTHKPLLEKMIKLNINYALLRINKSTDRMAYTFLQAYAAVSTGCTLHKANRYYREACNLSASSGTGSRIKQNFNRRARAGLLFEEQQLGTSYSALRHLVLKNVTNSASRTAVRTLSSGRTTKVGTIKDLETNLKPISEDEDDEEEVHLETNPPQWNTPFWLDETLMCQGFSPDLVVHDASTLDDMMTSDDNIKMSTMELTIHKRSRPFSQGMMRVASYARTDASNNRYVVKSFKRGGKGFPHLAEDMRCQSLCKAFALEFNALLDVKYSIDFIVSTCLKGISGSTSGDDCTSLEPFIDGAYVKYNNNCGYVNEEISGNRSNQAAQAFSHFTFERSKGRFLVSDLQGVGSILTDPAIHTLDPERFKLTDTNLGKEGIKFFFSTHVCNRICSKLKLKSNASMTIRDKYEFRENWPAMDNTVCCSNKLCGKIVRLASAKKSDKFPGHHWCDTCWPQLNSFVVKKLCHAQGPVHEFEVSKFFYESQGRSEPFECPMHREGDDTVSNTPVVVGRGLWAGLKAAAMR